MAWKKSPSRYLALCLAAFACFSAQAGDDGAPYLPDIKSENGMNWLAADEMRYLCAGNSIYVAAKLSGTDADFSEIFKRLYVKKSVGISIGEIEDELERLGIAHKTIRLSWAQIFANKGGLFIVYTPPPEGMDLGHFYVARVLDGCVQIVDPPSAPSIVQKDAFAPGERMSVIAVGSGFKPPFGFYATYAAGGALLALGAAALLFKLVRGKK